MTFFISIFDEIGNHLLFLNEIIQTYRRKAVSTHELINQIWKVTIESAVTTGFAGFFVGAIMTVQFTMQMKEFDALSFLGGIATSATVREVGPLLIAFMLAGKVGAFTSAELGTMRVTEQIDAVRCLGADPIQEIILPRFLAIIISSFFLLGLGLLLSICGGMLLGILFSGVNTVEYLRYIPVIVTKASIVGGLLKCFIFAFLIALICTYNGYKTTGGAKGVGRAVIKTAVNCLIAIVVADWLTSLISDSLIRIALGS
jgi:phospholipid/cholesterol/gamma-HCH transport system permease protein